MKRETGRVAINLERRYPTLVLAVLFFVACGAFLLHRATTNDRGLIINGIIELGPTGADVFYTVIGLLGLGMATAGGIAIVRLAQIENFRVLLGKDAMWLPHVQAWSGWRDAEIRYGDVLAVHAPPGARWVTIETKDGPRRVSGQWLPSSWTVQRVADAIVERWRAASEASSDAGSRSPRIS